MPKKTVYLETSFISYLTGRPSRDLLVAANQAITHEWWETRRHDFELYVSDLVLIEARRGDPQAAERRLAALDDPDVQVLALTPETEHFTQRLLDQRAVPEKAGEDAAHIAIACMNGIDYLLTWNCTHIANAECFKAIDQLCLEQDYVSPIICTPEELLGARRYGLE